MTITLTLYGSLLLNLAVSVVLPMVVALVTKQTAHPGLKAVVLLALNVIYGFGVGWVQADIAGQAFDIKAAGLTALVTFGGAVIAHFGLLKDVITGSGGLIQVNIPGGLGSSSSNGV